jgi:diguanylate cyclase (GGDEF)-like protein
MAGAAALVMAGLLVLLYVSRRRLFLLSGIAGWMLVAVSMLIGSRSYYYPQISWMAYGIAQFVAIIATLAFVVAADAYRHRVRIRRAYTLPLLPVAIWFSLAPAALGPPAVFAPGHILIAGGFLAAAVAHAMLVREARLLGAGIVAAAFVTLAGANIWVAGWAAQPDSPRTGHALVFTVVLYLVAALGMQLMTFEDMTYELRRTNRRLETAQSDLRQLVITDPLTGCRNRRFFDEIIGRELQRHRRYRTPLSLLFIDIDRFKTINDTLGHETGDRVLKQVASFLLRRIREADYVFRWGGDEFLVLISCEEDEARRRGLDLQRSFGELPEVAELPSGVGLSIGAVGVPMDTNDILPLLQSADERMYVNKKKRR